MIVSTYFHLYVCKNSLEYFLKIVLIQMNLVLQQKSYIAIFLL